MHKAIQWIILTLGLLLVFSIAAQAGEILIGDYTINYFYNAGGCYAGPVYDDHNPLINTDGKGNPYDCSYISPGPIFINAAPGEYRVAIEDKTGGVSANLWSGDALGGTRYYLDNLSIGSSVDINHTYGQIVLYAWDWNPYDNPSSSTMTVSLYKTVPEPSLLLLLGMGLGGVTLVAWRKNK
jgi:hypothetical protein